MYSATIKASDLPPDTVIRLNPGEELVIQKPLRFFVVGPAGAGKSAFARILAEELRAAGRGPVVLGECGEVLIGMLAKILAGEDLLGLSKAPARWADWIRANKARYRGSLRELGELLAAAHPGVVPCQALYGDKTCERTSDFCREARSATRICVGVRRAREFRELNNALGQGDIWIYVDRTGAAVAGDSFDHEFFLDACQVKVSNDGDLEALRAKARAFVATL